MFSSFPEVPGILQTPIRHTFSFLFLRTSNNKKVYAPTNTPLHMCFVTSFPTKIYQQNLGTYVDTYLHMQVYDNRIVSRQMQPQLTR